MSEETKKCPYCGEKVLAVAKKCKFCGEFFEKDEAKENISKSEIAKIRTEIEDLRIRIGRTPFKIGENTKKEFESAIDKCEGVFESICNPGYKPFSFILDFICVLIFLLAVICGFGTSSFSGFIVSVLIGIAIDLLFWLYFLPSRIAFRSRHKQAWLILIINLFFSIFCFPWFAILIWALFNKANEDVLTLEQSNRIRQEVFPMKDKINNKIAELWNEYKQKKDEGENV